MQLKDHIRNYLDRKKKAARGAIARPDDTFIVSYPKSGNTWTRFLVANLTAPALPVGFDNIERIIPDIYQQTPKQLAELPSPRILKSHEYFDPRYGKVLCIVRDPRDVAISYWHHYVKFKAIDENYPKHDFVDRFLAGSLGPFGSWGTNIGSWLGAREQDPDFLLIRYEDLLKSPTIEVRKIATLLGLSVTDQQIENAIQNASFEHMQALEQAQKDQWVSSKKSRHDMAFVREGRHAQWHDDLSAESISKIEHKWGALMDKLGYSRR
jgi:hypothetical protein